MSLLIEEKLMRYTHGRALVENIKQRRQERRTLAKARRRLAALREVTSRLELEIEEVVEAIKGDGETMVVALELLTQGMLAFKEEGEKLSITSCPCPACDEETHRVLREGRWVCDSCGFAEAIKGLLAIDQGEWGLHDCAVRLREADWGCEENILTLSEGARRLEVMPEGGKLYWRWHDARGARSGVHSP